MMRKGDVLELKIESLNFGGQGVARYETAEGKLVVFVEDTVPGDVARVRIGTRKRNHAIGYVVDFEKKADNRVPPRCRHFGACGGCSMQFLTYEDQLKMKEQHVRDAMKRIGGFDEKVVTPIIACKEPWFYRNKMEFSFSRDVSGVLSLGLHVRRRHHDLIELTECFLLGDYAGELVTKVRDFFREKDKQGALAGELRLLSLIIREGKNSGEIMVNLVAENGEPDFLDEFVKLIMDFFEGLPSSFLTHAASRRRLRSEGLVIPSKITSIYFTKIVNKKGCPKSINEKLLWGEPVIHEEMQLENGLRLKFEISPQAFFQPNTAQAEVLYGEALKAAQLSGREVVFDLFCGAGTIGSFCASAAKKVYGIEMNESAVKNARSNASLNGIQNIEFIAGDVAKVLPHIKEKPDVVLVDPPRGGMDPKAVELLAELRARRIVYVSCNPTTLARDLRLMTKTGYKLVSVQPVDMFPQTYHIECVAALERSESAY